MRFLFENVKQCKIESNFKQKRELDDECEPIVEQFKASAIQDQLPYELADRDFEEKYGKMELLEVVNNSKLLKELEAFRKRTNRNSNGTVSYI